MWSRKVIKENAQARIKANYWKMVVAGLILAIFTGGNSGFSYNFDDTKDISEAMQHGDLGLHTFLPRIPDALWFVIGIAIAFGIVFGIIFAVFVANSLILGARKFFLSNIKNDVNLSDLGDGFRQDYLNRVKTMFLKDLFIALWTLLLIIPGIIKTYEYRMIDYILAENPGIDSKEAFEISRKMMMGNKWKAFVFDLSFLGWFILSAFTAGIVGIFYVNPYYYQASAMLYDAIKYDCGMATREPQPEVEHFDTSSEDVF